MLKKMYATSMWKEISIKLSVSIILLLCLLDMPYGFYQLARFLALIAFSILAYIAHKQNRTIEMVIYIFLALLFQPLLKISLGRALWNIVDGVVAVGLIITIVEVFIKKKK